MTPEHDTRPDRPRTEDAPAAPRVPVPNEYCSGGVCWNLADQWGYLQRYRVWIPVCAEHRERIEQWAEQP